jgi:ATP-dependent RNA helicase DDX52/ROK1
MIIFVEGISKLNRLYEEIRYDFPKISFLHSKMSKAEREDSIKKFRIGETWILICTDLLSRGIDFKNVKTVLNYDCPYNPINYIHKIGRTGRGGKLGKAFTFIIDDDIKKLRNLSKMLSEIVI